jgi:hypothetical protein
VVGGSKQPGIPVIPVINTVERFSCIITLAGLEIQISSKKSKSLPIQIPSCISFCSEFQIFWGGYVPCHHHSTATSLSASQQQANNNYTFLFVCVSHIIYKMSFVHISWLPKACRTAAVRKEVADAVIQVNPCCWSVVC